jgi:fatty-acyl-CoA synthase
MFQALADHPDREDYDMSSLRTGIIAGEPCPMATLLRVVEELCMDEVTVAYGAAEVGAVAFQSNVDDPLELRTETVGRVHPNIEAKIVDRDGHIVPIGCRGELCIRGYSVMRGYWDESKRTRDAFDANGWLRSGDLATLDAQGYCRILGRVKDVLIRGGQPIWPDEIEALLRSHPKVEDAQVFGVPDARQEDDICAWIVLKPGAIATVQEISAFCRSRIGPDCVPRHIRFVSAFPVNASGQARKTLMRAMALRQLGAEEAKAI